jgi:N-acetyl-D-muramate 6-phosphate phosphatase
VPTKSRALLWDLDGTLLDTAPDMVGAVNELRVTYGLPRLPMADLRPMVSRGGKALLSVGFAHLDEAARDELLPKFLSIYRERIAFETTFFSGVETLMAYCDHHHIAQGIVTNKPGWLTDALLDALQLRHHFGVVISGDTLSERKPSALPLVHAAQVLNADIQHSWMFGDDQRDIAAGVAAGCCTAVALYGYLHEHEARLWGADVYVSDAGELMANLEVV